uniref:EF-hand domain-containing protein n=1 Tax=Rhabditophanes sp. KR3021 TaxID=114890 RepID=A0AC35U5E2_9BILA
MGDDVVADAFDQLSAEQIEQFRKYFNMFDKESKGYIRATQVGQILRTMGQAFEDRDLKQLIKQFDADGSGEIEFEEFAAMVANFVVSGEDNSGLEEELREAFRLYDKEGNGYINVSDLRDILRALDDNISEEELDEMITEIDADGSGTVDFDEFMEMMSGTLCSLVGEIGQLRKENRKLRRRILENSTSSTETTPPVAARLGVVHRVGAFLDSGRTSIIPKLLPSYRKMLSSNEIRTGARERLSSPPRKDCLTTSSYSTDYSIDNLSLRSQKMKIPPLVLPEMSDSENENSIFAEVMLPEIDVTEQNNIDKLDSLLRPRRSMMRRLHVNSHQKGSDHASPSSISASSSIEPPDTMSSSRASFLEFIGIKRKSERNRMSMPIPSNFNVGAFINKKQRKRKMTENENVDARNNYEKTLAIKQKGDSKTGKDEEKPAVRKSTLKPSFAKSCRSLFEKQPTNCKTHFYDESEEESLYKNKKQRPKSVVYLEPDRSTIVASHIQKKAASYKNMMDSRDTSEENYRHTNQNEYIGLRNENVSLKNELDNLKNFNSKLTEDLTQKNKVVENLENKYASLERQSDSWKRKCIMNEAFDNAYQNERLESQKIKMINKIDGKLSEFEKTLKNVKEECVKNQQLMLNHSIRDQNAYQSCLEQVERLQRENFALIQMNATDKDFDEDDENMRRKLKMMPSTQTKTKIEKIIGEQFLAAENDEVAKMHEESLTKPFKAEIVWRNVVLFTILHATALLGAYHLFFCVKWQTFVWTFACWIISGLGITAGAHRLWSHKSYKASMALKIFLMLCNSMAVQNSVVEWSRDHRSHHKWTDSDADPHNINRGFFFSHMGWLMVRKHPKVAEKGKQLDMSDLENDPVLAFQKKYYFPMLIFWGFVFPTWVAVAGWDETPFYAFYTAGLFRYTKTLHFTWSINSVSHMFGYKPYNKDISPTDNLFTSLVAIGEGGHNYHHTFPQDYKTAEGYAPVNITKMFIDLMYYFGQAYDLKEVEEEVIARQNAQKGKDPRTQ